MKRGAWFGRSGGAGGAGHREAGKRGSPGLLAVGVGGQTCDGSLAERTLLVGQGAGPRAGVRAKLGSREIQVDPSPGQSPRAQWAARTRSRIRKSQYSPPPPPRTKLEAENEAGSDGAGVRAQPARGRRAGPPGAALTMSYTLSTTNWLAPILLPAAAASSSSRSVSAGPRPLPPPRTPQGARAGSTRAARPAAAGAGASGSRAAPGRRRQEPLRRRGRPVAGPLGLRHLPSAPDTWGKAGPERGAGTGSPGGGASPAPQRSPPALWLSAAAPRDLKWRRLASLHLGGAEFQGNYSSQRAVRSARGRLKRRGGVSATRVLRRRVISSP